MTLEQFEIPGLEISDAIAAGASAMVWRARHVLTDELVAVKLMHAASGEWARAFEREARALAKLDHRCVAYVHDLGVVKADAGDRPYLVMEYATHGALSEVVGELSLAQWARIMIDVLAGLSHIHAHGLLHLDIKPSNILLTRHDADSALGVRVADIALGAMFAGGRVASVGGTRGYAAPEQLGGDVGSVGPHSDLWSVGALGLELLSGERADLSGDVVSVTDVIARACGQVPWLVELFDAMLSPDPARRLASALTARRWIEDHIQPSELREEDLRRAEGASSASTELTTLYTALSSTPMTLSGARGIDPYGVVADEEERLARPGSPWLEVQRDLDAAGWADSTYERSERPLIGLGAALISLRTPRFFGREEERAALWATLIDADRAGAVRVALRGEPGVGRSRLLEWFAATAFERAGAKTLRAVEIANESMVRAHARHAREVMELTGASLAQYGAQAASLFKLEDAPNPGRAGWSMNQAVELFAMLWSDLPAGCIAVVVADDLPDASHLLGLYDALSDRSALDAGAAGAGVVFAASVSAQAPRRARDIEVTRLERDELAMLVRSSLGIDISLANEIAARVDGSPKLALALVREWLERGLLRPSARGLYPETWSLPWFAGEDEDLEIAAYERAWSGLGGDARAELWILALAGERVERAWLDAARLDPTRLAAYDFSYLEVSEDHVRFVAPGARDFVLRARGVDERASALVDSARRAFEHVYPEPRSSFARLEMARFEVEAGEPLLALAMLRSFLFLGIEHDLAGRCLALIERVSAQVGSEHHLTLEVLTARARYSLGEHNADLDLDVDEVALSASSGEVRFAYWDVKLLSCLARSERDAAREFVEQIRGLLDESAIKDSLRARALATLARANIHLRDLELARDYGARACALVDERADPMFAIAAYNIYAVALLECGDLDEAARYCERTFPLARDAGVLALQVHSANTLGDIEMRRKNWDAATTWLHRGRELVRDRYPLAGYIWGNLAWVAINADDPETALEHVETVTRRLAETEPSIVKCFVLELKHVCLAMLDRPARWDAAIGELDEILEHVQRVHDEGVEGAQRAAAIWTGRGDLERAARADALAQRLAALLGA